MTDFPQYERPTGNRATEEDIYFAYRLILRRDPDPEGYAIHRKYIENGDITLERMLGRFFNSNEYRLKQEAGTLPTAVDVGGYKVVVQKGEIDFGKTIASSHFHEKHVCDAFREFLHKDDVVVDVGANVGVMTFLAATIVCGGGLVIAVEPNPNNVQLLYRGILINGFSNVRVLPYAASNIPTVFSLSADTSNTSVINARVSDVLKPCVQSVVLDEQLAALPRINFVKMDIEGHEPRALEGFAKLLNKHRPVLLVEFNPRCLNDQRQVPLAFLNQIFAIYRRVRVTSGFKDDVTLDSADKVLEYWEKRNREVFDQKLLPDRMLHFDLIGLP